jgi:flagellar biogenesis protein FliO
VEMTDPMPALAGVLAVLAAALWWLRKKGAVRFRPGVRRPSRRLQSIERLALSPHHALHLVRLDDRAILVAQSPSGLALLERPENAAARAMAEHA